MQSTKKIGTIFFLLFVFSVSIAQTKLSLNNAIQIAIENNYNVQIFKNNYNIAQLNNDISFTGGAPIVNATINEQYQNNTIHQYFSDINTHFIERSGISNNNINANITGSIIIFNGFRIKTTTQKLKEIEKQSLYSYKAQVFQTIADISGKYYEIIQQQKMLLTIQSTIQLNTQKLEIIKQKNKIGLGNQSDILQANIDYNYAVQLKQNQELLIKQLKIDLLKLMASNNLDSNYALEDSIYIDRNIILDSIIHKIKINPTYIANEQQVKINELIEKETMALAYPLLRLNAGYAFSNIYSEAGFTILNRNYGPFIGININIPIFAGNIVKKGVAISKLNTKSASLIQKQNILETTAQVYKLYHNYVANLSQIETEKQNILLSTELLQTTLEKYKIAAATIIELQQAQQNYDNSNFRLYKLQYLTAVLAIELKKYAGDL